MFGHLESFVHEEKAHTVVVVVVLTDTLVTHKISNSLFSYRRCNVYNGEKIREEKDLNQTVSFIVFVIPLNIWYTYECKFMSYGGCM